MSSAIGSILEKCDVYFNGELISRENILEKYFSFFADVINPEERSVGIALHTGSVCFDVASVVAVGIGCLAYNLATNDDIIARLQPGEMVMYKNQRYRWMGTTKMNDSLYLGLEQDGVGRNGPSKRYVPYETNKHLVLPYYGNSQKTDGRGVKKRDRKRERFLSSLFDIPVADVPAEIDISVVIVADRGAFADLCKGVSIEYGDNERINLLDIIPASYFTSGGIQHPFGSNPTKAEPVIKVTGDLSAARELVLDKHGNKVVGLLVFGSEVPKNGSSELADLLRRKALKFAVVESPLYSKFGGSALELCEDASVFACTKEYLMAERKKVGFSNEYTEELSRRMSVIIDNSVTPIKVDGGIGPEEYKKIREGLVALKQSNMSKDIKDEFILTAQGMLNLLNTAVFTMEELEEAIKSGAVNATVKSPKMRIEYLWKLTEDAGVMQDLCLFITDAIERQYRFMCTHSPKAELLDACLSEHTDSRIAVIVPKAYYVDILNGTALQPNANILYITPNKFDAQKEYDLIFVCGEIGNRKFDPLSCRSAVSVEVLLYECEKRAFSYHKKKAEKYEYALNRKIGVASEPVEEDSPEEKIEEEKMQQLISLDDYIESFRTFDIRKFAASSRQYDGSLLTSEVTHIGTFTSGEQILFSKYYSAVVFDSEKGTVIEKASSALSPGDVLVFTIRNDYTQNIVDTIYESLLKSGRMSENSLEMYEKSKHWKESLRKFKSKNGFTYREVAKELKKYGSSLQEVTIRQWLTEDSHIVGPRAEKTLGYIAKMTEDSSLLQDLNGHFEACKYVRGQRRKILNWIAKAINDKLMGFVPGAGSVLEIVYDNIEKLSETKELEEILELDESVEVNINLVNRPITEAEM